MTCLLYILYILINLSIKCHILLIFIISLASPNSYVLHQELLNFMIVAMSIQLLSGPSPGPRDANPFIDAAMSQVTSSLIFFFIFCIDFTPDQLLLFLLLHNLQEKSLVFLAVRRLLLNYIFRTPPNAKGYLYSDGDSPGILERVGSATGRCFCYILCSCCTCFILSGLTL